MVLKGLNLARISLTKAFTHGSAQSFVAASQSSYAAQNSPFGTLANSLTPWQTKSLTHNHPGFNHAFGQNNPQPAQNNQQDSLATFLATWNKQQKPTDTDHQHVYPKRRIVWKRAGSTVDSSEKPEFDPTKLVIDEEAVIFEDDLVSPVSSRRRSHTRSYSSSQVDSLPNTASDASVIPPQFSPNSTSVFDQPLGSSGSSEITQEGSQDAVSTLPVPLGQPLSDREAEILRLVDSGRFADIPIVFDDLLAAGHTPSTASYNALLKAVLVVARSKGRAAPKAVEVYTDMIQRKVSPDTSTYTELLDMLSTRALEISEAKAILERKRSWFKSMTNSDLESSLIFSDRAELEKLSSDASLNKAIELFDSSSGAAIKAFPEATYHLLISACAKEKRIDDMIRVYSRMELRRVTPQPATFIAMIGAFASIGDLRSAVDTYNEYKSLAIENDNGELDIERQDFDMYIAIVRAYHHCGRPEGGDKFTERILDSLSPVSRLAVRDAIDFKAVLPHLFDTQPLQVSLERLLEYSDNTVKRNAMELLTTEAADSNNLKVATEAFDSISEMQSAFRPVLALCAMHLRSGNIAEADRYWKLLESGLTAPVSELVDLSTMYTLSLVKVNRSELGLQMARKMFVQAREISNMDGSGKSAAQAVDRAIETIDQYIVSHRIGLSLISSLELMRLLIENDGLLPSVASHALEKITPECLSILEPNDLAIVAQVQAGLILSNQEHSDSVHAHRLIAVAKALMNCSSGVDGRTANLVSHFLSTIGDQALLEQWNRYCQSPKPEPSISPVTPPAVNPSFDLYGSTTDNKASVEIMEVLENPAVGPATRLNDALSRYRTLRLTGRHPRYYVYSRMISEAANAGQFSTCQDILSYAYKDIPPKPQFWIVKHGWTTILDSMIVACLTTGHRHLADQYHAELLGLGSAPTANTFGLYITTLKEGVKSFDEAAEAVRIFTRAQVEGVEPTSFLYNALIGKLGKARRIDDCLFFFNEMRAKGVRPTSVTYGTIVNALCRVGDERYAEELFDEMEAAVNYKPRPAPYHSMMQFFLTADRNRTKVLGYYERMRKHGIRPTSHTYKLLIDTFATIEPVDMPSAEKVLEQIISSGDKPDAVHYSSLIHANGCVLHDMAAARTLFDKALSQNLVKPQACLYQALFESMVANGQVEKTEPILEDMMSRGIGMTAYVANALIHGWSIAGQVSKAAAVFNQIPSEKREPSAYESMARAFVSAGDRDSAVAVVNEALSRGYPAAVSNKIMDIINIGSGPSRTVDHSPLL